MFSNMVLWFVISQPGIQRSSTEWFKFIGRISSNVLIHEQLFLCFTGRLAGRKFDLPMLRKWHLSRIGTEEYLASLSFLEIFFIGKCASHNHGNNLTALKKKNYYITQEFQPVKTSYVLNAKVVRDCRISTGRISTCSVSV